MKIKLTPLLVLAVAVAASGCQTLPQTPATAMVKETEYRIVSIPQSMLQLCDTTPPPKQSDYAKLTFSEKEDVLTKYSLALQTNIASCNVQIQGIRDYQAKTIKTYDRLDGDKPQNDSTKKPGAKP